MKTCKSIKKQLVSYVLGELDEVKAVLIRDHLESCETCRAEYETHRATLGALGDALEMAPAPERLPVRSPAAQISRERRLSLAEIWQSLQLRSSLAAGALAALFILISGGIVVFEVLPRRQAVPFNIAKEKAAPKERDLGEIHKKSGRSELERYEDSFVMEVEMNVHPLERPELDMEALFDSSPDVELAQADFQAAEFSYLGESGSALDAVEEGLAPSFSTEEYGVIAANTFKRSKDHPLSTFAIEVDCAAYANVRRFLKKNELPPADAVRVEEMVNYFPYDYPQPQGEDPFAISLEVGDCPWNQSHKLAMIGLQGVKVDTSDLPPNNLVFLLDVSGSMESADKLPLLKASMRLLVEQLRPQDRVSIVVYAGAAGLVLEPTADKRLINEAIDELYAGGSTADSAGIELAYQIAKNAFIKEGNNRVILATDGDFNVGMSSDGDLLRLIEKKRKSGIYLSVLGFGTGNLKDSRMERLADRGNGNYAYIDDILEAKKTLVNEMGGTLLSIAKDVKIQVEFNPAQVKGYRLIGYENRVLANEDFSADAKDGGELGAGHSVTALYELIAASSDEAVPAADALKYQTSELVESSDLLTVKLRYKQPNADTSKQLVRSVALGDYSINPSEDFRFASEVAEFALLLRDSEYRGNASYNGVLKRARAVKGSDPEGYRAEFIRMVEKAHLLEQQKSL